MLRYTLLIDGEFGFDSTMGNAERSTVYIGKISARRIVRIAFVCNSTPDSYHDAYDEGIEDLERQLEQQLMQANAQRMQEHRQTGLSPGWLRLTIVERWAEEVD